MQIHAVDRFRQLIGAALTLICLLLAAPVWPQGLNAFLGCEEHLQYGVPHEGTPREVTPLCRLGYALAHNTDRKTADWVAWHLTTKKALGCLPRKNTFKADPDLARGTRAELVDYRNSGYDRGHIAPNADFLWSEIAQRESFLLSNMSPQLGSFNGGIWKYVEELTRVWATTRGEVLVIAGPIYSDMPLERIGRNRVAVPPFYFKIIFDPKSKQAVAFIFPHAQTPRSQLPTLQATVREIEAQTGLDFFNTLAADEQAVLESTKVPIWEADIKSWNVVRKSICSGAADG